MTSTADISFMLLVLLLVASSMNLDKGLSRRLPAIDKTKTPPATVDSRKVMRIAINAENQVALDEKIVTMKELLQRAAQLIQTSGKGHLIQLQGSRNTSYDTYIHTQDQLVAAYNILHNQHALNLFGKEFGLCSNEQQKQVTDEVPTRISEVYTVSKADNTERGDTEWNPIAEEIIRSLH